MDMELEATLRPPEYPMAPYPAKVITLATGVKMVVRQVDRDAVPILLEAVRPAIEVERDYYDIVAARLYAELLGWYRYRVKDEFCIVGQIEGYAEVLHLLDRFHSRAHQEEGKGGSPVLEGHMGQHADKRGDGENGDNRRHAESHGELDDGQAVVFPRFW